MRSATEVLAVVALTLIVSACGAQKAHDYPAEARQQFAADCTLDDVLCACMWDEITKDLTYPDYEVALERFRTEGLMDPRITKARTSCFEQHSQKAR